MGYPVTMPVLSHPPLLVLCHHPEEDAGVLMVPLKALFSEGRDFSALGRGDLHYICVREKGAYAAACEWIRRHPDGVAVYNGGYVFTHWTTLRILAACNWRYHNRQVAYWREGATLLRDITGMEGGGRWRRCIRRLQWRITHRFLLNQRTWHVVNNRQCKQLIMFLFGIEPVRIVVSGSTINVSECPVADRLSDRNGFRLCMAGELTHRKGLDIFVDFADKHREWQGRRWEYTWFGGGENWLNIIKARPVGKRATACGMTFAGHVSPLPVALVDQDIFLLTSREEPFGVVALEALACDLPVFCFETAGISEFVPDEFICWDPDDMIEKVKTYLKNMDRYPPGFFRRMAEQRGHDGFYRGAWERLFRGLRAEVRAEG